MNSFQASLIALVFLLVGGFVAARAQTPAEKPSAPLKAVAVLHPTAGNKVNGTVTFTEVADGVQIRAEITGLTPGNHGFHVHEFGDCSAADASSAGAHFNPTHKPHAGPDTSERHVGDMGNVQSDAPLSFTRRRTILNPSLLGTPARALHVASSGGQKASDGNCALASVRSYT